MHKLESTAGCNSTPHNTRLGLASLICGLVTCLGMGMILLAELGWIPREVKLGGGTMFVVGVCWLVAVVGGTVAAVGSKSWSGCLAALICLLLPVGVAVLAGMVGSGWLD